MSATLSERFVDLWVGHHITRVETCTLQQQERHNPAIPISYHAMLFGSIVSWWEFRPRKKIFSPPPPPNFVQTPSRPLAPPPPPARRPPSPGIFSKIIFPPNPGASDSPFPSPEQEKIKNIRNVHQGLLIWGFKFLPYL